MPAWRSPCRRPRGAGWARFGVAKSGETIRYTYLELRPDVEVISTAYGGVFGQVLVAWDAGKPCPIV